MTSDKKPTERSLAAARELLPCLKPHDGGSCSESRHLDYCPASLRLSFAHALDAARAEERAATIEKTLDLVVAWFNATAPLRGRGPRPTVLIDELRASIRTLAEPEPSEE